MLDVMPVEAGVLGFSNRWYKLAMQTAELCEVEPSLQVRAITAPLFVAAKLEAFKGRGGGDYFASHDIEDVISVMDGRPELVAEIASAAAEVRCYLSAEFASLLREHRFTDTVAAHLPPDAVSQSRVPLILQRMREIADVRNRFAYWEELRTEVASLRHVLDHPKAGASALQLFDEFVREGEYALALCIVCDFLLKDEVAAPTVETLAQIQHLQSTMGLVDACFARLKQKANQA